MFVSSTYEGEEEADVTDYGVYCDISVLTVFML